MTFCNPTATVPGALHKHGVDARASAMFKGPRRASTTIFMPVNQVPEAAAQEVPRAQLSRHKKSCPEHRVTLLGGAARDLNEF